MQQNVSSAPLPPPKIFDFIAQEDGRQDYKLPDWKATTEFGPAISHLAVVQCGFERLSAGDEKWFRTRLMEFHWSAFFFSLYVYVSSLIRQNPVP